MTTKFRLYTVRHGQTEANIAGIMQGSLNGQLTETGRSQAAKLGKYLSTMGPAAKFSHAYCSPLTRARTTAGCILRDSRQSALLDDIVVDHRLAERHYGKFEGTSIAQLRGMARDQGKMSFQFDPDTAETVADLRLRVLRFFLDLCGDIARGNSLTDSTDSLKENSNGGRDKEAQVLLVSHGFLMRDFFRLLTEAYGCEIPGGKESLIHVTPNTGMSVFEIQVDSDSGKPRDVRCLTLHSVEHLEH